jgi:hypothetical protein
MNEEDRPPVLRACIWASLAAPAAAAAGLVLLSIRDGLEFGLLYTIWAIVAGFMVVFVAGGLHLLLLGLPLYYLLRRVVRVGWANSAAAGLAIGALSMALLEGSFESPFPLLVGGIPGLAAGLAFGLTLDRHARRLTAEQHGEIFS